jgi:Na+/H+ antiporter NhaA
MKCVALQVGGRQSRRVGCVTVNKGHFQVYVRYLLIPLIALLEAGISVENPHQHAISGA